MAMDSLASYRKAIAGLRARAVPTGKSLPTALEELAEKWNPLYAEDAKANLVEDVNALARDFLRSLRKGFLVSPPTLERLKGLAKQLAADKHLEQIRKKEPLERYLRDLLHQDPRPEAVGRTRRYFSALILTSMPLPASSATSRFGSVSP